MDRTTTAYSATGEVSGSGYTAGGATITNATAPAKTGGTGIVAFWTPSAALSWAALTLAAAFDAVLFYNSTTSGNPAIAVFSFGSQVITAGTLSLSMPSNDLSTGLLRLS